MSMNKKNRSLINTRYEAKKIYYQRKTINFIEKRNYELKEENKQLKDRINKAIKITYKIIMNNADNRMICNKEEEEYFDWLDREMLEQEKILKGE